jgi:predicted  nucleic acid-binding Zn-ribbon protein
MSLIEHNGGLTMTRIDSNVSAPPTGSELPARSAVSGDAPAAVTLAANIAIEPTLAELFASAPATFGLGVPGNPQDFAVILAQLRAVLDDYETANRNHRSEVDNQNRSEAERHYREAAELETQLADLLKERDAERLELATLNGERADLDDAIALIGDRIGKAQDEIASLKDQIAATGDDTERTDLEEKLARAQAGLDQLQASQATLLARRADLDQSIKTTGDRLDETENKIAAKQLEIGAETKTALAFLIAFLAADLAGTPLDKARQALFDSVSEIGSDKIKEVLAKFDPPGIDRLADEDAETRRLLELLAGSLVTIVATVRALREEADLPAPQAVSDEALRNQRRQLVL